MKLKLLLFTAITLLMCHLSVFAQEGDKQVKQKITDEQGNPTMIFFNEQSVYKVGDYLQIFKDQLHLDDDTQYIKTTSETDQLGYLNEKFQLFHKGVKVEFSTYSLHSKKGKIVSMNGEFYTLKNINTIPSIAKNQAFDNALKQVGATAYLWDNPAEAQEFNYNKPEGELVLLPISTTENGATSLRLA